MRRWRGSACLRDLGQLFHLLQAAVGSGTPVRTTSLATSAQDVVHHSENLLITAPFADDLVVTTMSGRSLERTRRRYGARQLRGSHVVIRAGRPGNEPGSHEPVRDLDDGTVLALLTVGLNFHGVTHFDGVQQTFVIVCELVCSLVACCLEDLVRGIDAHAGGAEEAVAGFNGAQGKGDTVVVDVMIRAGAGRIGQFWYKSVGPFARLNVFFAGAHAYRGLGAPFGGELLIDLRLDRFRNVAQNGRRKLRSVLCGNALC